MRRGQIWLGNLNPSRGVEVGKTRPVLVIQSDEVNASSIGTVVVLPLSSDKSGGEGPARVKVVARGRLAKESFVLVDQPRALDKKRFSEGPLAELDAFEMVSVDRGLRLLLGF